MAAAIRVTDTSSNESVLSWARMILHAEAAAIERVSRLVDARFAQAVDCVLECRGSIVVSGVGKAGLIAQKLAATFASTGTRSHFLHPTEAVHGDLGRVCADDLALLLSYSGETEEVVRLIEPLRASTSGLVAITASADSTLGRAADLVLRLGKIPEACSLGLAPSTTTTSMLALGDALALVVCRRRGFTADNFARNHPAGNLGRQLKLVDQVMRPIADCRVARDQQTVREVIVSVSKPGRRTGAVMLLDEHGELSGIFTDSDLARLLELRSEHSLDRSIAAVMTRSFVTIPSGSKLPAAVKLMAERKISELPVLDVHSRPVGLIDITDVMGLVSSHDFARRSLSTYNASVDGSSEVSAPVVSIPIHAIRQQ